MELVAANRFYGVYYDYDNALLVIEWKEDLYELTITEYKSSLMEVHQYIKDLRPKLLLHDGRKAMYPSTDELNIWIAENISPVYITLGISKIAYIYSKDQATKNFMDEIYRTVRSVYESPERKFFFNYDEAIHWLLEG